MILFCDDLNVATANVKDNDFEAANELLRQLLDCKMLFNLQKPFDRRFIEGLAFTTALSTSQTSVESTPLSDRILVSIEVRFGQGILKQGLFECHTQSWLSVKLVWYTRVYHLPAIDLRATSDVFAVIH